MDRFREIEAFVAVVEAGSFVKAGESLRISKAAVSRSVLDLEQRLGTRLLQRTTRRLSLTEAGRTYFDRGKRLLSDLHEADGTVASAPTPPVGGLKVSVPLAFGTLHLDGLWAAFMRRYPDLRLNVWAADREVDLIDEGFDLEIRVARPRDAALVSRQLAVTQLVLCAAPAYLERRGIPENLQALSSHDLIAFSAAMPEGTLRLMDGQTELAATPPPPRIHCNNALTCHELALSGTGIALLPDYVIGHDLHAGRLARVLPGLRGAEAGIQAVYPARRHLSVKVRLLIDHLAEHFRTPRW